METTYTLRLGQLLKVAPNFNRYMWWKLKPEKPNIATTMISEPSVAIMIKTHFKVNIIVIKVDNQMAVIQV